MPAVNKENLYADIFLRIVMKYEIIYFIWILCLFIIIIHFLEK